jgi:hypothetical protein
MAIEATFYTKVYRGHVVCRYAHRHTWPMRSRAQDRMIFTIIVVVFYAAGVLFCGELFGFSSGQILLTFVIGLAGAIGILVIKLLPGGMN